MSTKRWIYTLACLIGVLTLLSSTLAAPALASPDLPKSSNLVMASFKLYMPIVIHIPEPKVANLSSPANKAVLTTRIPTFSWSMINPAPQTTGCFALGTSPNPTTCENFAADTNGGQLTKVTPNNLAASTVYYWRIGLWNSGNTQITEWSVEWSFTSGPAGTMLPPPNLTSPINNSTVFTNGVTLYWQPVSGAVEYKILVHNKTTNTYYTYFTTSTNYSLPSSILITTNQYEWNVKARNNDAWGVDSNFWNFKYQPANG